MLLKILYSQINLNVATITFILRHECDKIIHIKQPALIESDLVLAAFPHCYTNKPCKLRTHSLLYKILTLLFQLTHNNQRDLSMHYPVILTIANTVSLRSRLLTVKSSRRNNPNFNSYHTHMHSHKLQPGDIDANEL